MNCDYRMLEKYAADLKTELKNLSDIITSIENSFSRICNSEWNSPTKDYLSKRNTKISKDDNLCFNKQVNINNYLQNVINNYRATENQMQAAVSNAFGGLK